MVLAVFQAQIELAEEVIARAAQFRRRGQLGGQPLHFAQDQLEGSFRVIGVQARRDDDVAGVVKEAVGAVNGIGQAVLLAHGLEEARTHVFAQDGVEQAQGETAFVMPGTGADAQGELGLFRFLAQQAQGRFGLRADGGRETGPRAAAEFPGVFGRRRHHLAMRDPPARRQHRRRGDIVLRLKRQQLVATEAVEGFFRAGDGAAQRLIGPHGGIEQFLHVLLGLVHVHGQFLFDHLAFLVNFLRIEGGMEKHVRQHVEQPPELVVPRLGVKTGVFLARKRIEVAAHALDGLRDFAGRTTPGALEQQMFDEMRHAAQRLRLVTSAHADPDAQADAGAMGHFRRDDG